MPDLIGTEKNDSLLGTTNPDRIFGLAGDDTIEGGASSDTLNGGKGNDSITGNVFPLTRPDPIDFPTPQTPDEAILIPIDLGDLISGGQGNDTIAGGLGDDTIRGGSDNDLIYGGDAPHGVGIIPFDVVPQAPIPIPFPANDGNDLIFAGSGDDTVYGGSGADTIRGGSGNDLIIGGNQGLAIPLLPPQGVPTLDTPTFLPEINDLGDELRGGRGDDSIRGGSGSDTISGGTGDDEITGGIGADAVKGNAGNDSLNGGIGDDTIRGGIGDDEIIGGTGNDEIIGGSGKDILVGVDANSKKPGQQERDTFTGGSGADRFILGDETSVFYDDSDVPPTKPPIENLPLPSFGLITDFQLGLDVIQLNGAESYKLQKVDLSGDAFGIGIYFDPNQQGNADSAQLIGIIQSDDNLEALTFQTVGSIIELS